MAAFLLANLSQFSCHLARLLSVQDRGWQGRQQQHNEVRDPVVRWGRSRGRHGRRNGHCQKKEQKRMVFPQRGVIDLPSRQIHDFCPAILIFEFMRPH